MKRLFPFVFIFLFITSCNSIKRKNDFLSPTNLISQLFTINPEKDTILHTSHSAILKIRKGSFKGNTSINLEIKEAYTPEEILLAGLTTTSGGKPLRSAGMLFFNATIEGKKIEPLIPIEAIIPSKNPEPEMQVFKGKEDSDGNIDWIEPQSIDTSKPEDYEQLYANGRALFLGKCASCHNIFKDATGPALKNLQFRGPWKNPQNILAWVSNPARFMSKNSYAQELKKKYGSMMTAFVDLRMEDIMGILTYVNNVRYEEEHPAKDRAVKKDSAKTNPVATIDTIGHHNNQDCGFDTTYISYKEEFPEYDTTVYPTILLADTIADPIDPYDPVFRDIYNEGYEFNIDANGWYNIDAFLKIEMNEVENVKLIADLKMSEDAFMNVYVFVPTERIMQNTYTKKGTQYYFDYEKGAIPLPLRHRAVIFAFGSYKDKILYGVSEFTIGKDQTIPVEIKETTKEGLKNLLFSKRLDGIELEAIEKKMEIYKIPCNDTTMKINSADILQINQ